MLSPLLAQKGLEHPLFQAMRLEMNRSLKNLKMDPFKSPYFLSYQILDSSDAVFTARYGAMTQEQTYRNRFLYVDLRYGSYEMDNTDVNYRGVTESIAVEDDHDSLRQALWLATDQSYKQALKGYLEKQGKKVSEMEKEKAPDFSQEVPYRTVCPRTADVLDFSDYKLVLKNVSAEFKQFTEILDSGISLRSNQRAQYLLNSEGTQILCPASGNPYFIYIWAKSQSPDGMTLEVART
ncbi:MAG: hypothetical protein HYY63_05830, partial [Elusimicrobia bacterium]|nr:hypothetical protein [Elusimicrobiota bacterium]